MTKPEPIRPELSLAGDALADDTHQTLGLSVTTSNGGLSVPRYEPGDVRREGLLMRPNRQDRDHEDAKLEIWQAGVERDYAQTVSLVCDIKGAHETARAAERYEGLMNGFATGSTGQQVMHQLGSHF